MVKQAQTLSTEMKTTIPQLGTQVQCTATGTCIDVNGGVTAALDPTTNQPVDVGAFGIPPGSNLQKLTPAPMSPGE
jgi:hypothetical protein